ncbi:MAG: cis-prenyltransferase [Thelocarpon impressellum]|nr:MAG: cis-prenyltransferase [Thelocarpon impressellum]
MPSLQLSTRAWLLSSPPVEWAVRQLRELLIGAFRQGPIPQHVAFVMDGNRRFARSRRIETVEGHNLGFEALARILEVCYKSGVTVVTIYAFSIENFKRSKYEVDALMDMAKVKLSQLAQHGDLLERYGARVRILGQRELVKPDVLEAMDRAVELTQGNTSAVLNVCFPYTSRDEMATAIRDTVAEYSVPGPGPPRPFSESHIARNMRARHLGLSGSSQPPSPPTSDVDDSLSSSTTLQPDTPPSPDTREPAGLAYPDPEGITARTLDDHMYTAGCPPLELLVRTSGVERLSDFMLWQCHQDTQIVFLDCLWPEFDLWHFLPVLVEWQWRRRKLGERDRMVRAASRGAGLVKVA